MRCQAGILEATLQMFSWCLSYGFPDEGQCISGATRHWHLRNVSMLENMCGHESVQVSTIVCPIELNELIFRDLCEDPISLGHNLSGGKSQVQFVIDSV